MKPQAFRMIVLLGVAVGLSREQTLAHHCYLDPRRLGECAESRQNTFRYR